ncbi:MAG TPA: bestrophin family ion channel [Phnomibacter sp.]|nr:bestrophin family ion channel [Phnomibacter sp.]
MLLRKNIPLKYVLGKIKFELVFVSAYTVGIYLLYHNFHFTRITMPIALPAIMGTVISLLLAFRSNQAYDRWWEARIIWGAIVNDSRTLARQVVTFLETPYKEEELDHFRHRFVRRQIAWCHALGQSLRHKDADRDLERLIPAREANYVQRYSNVPAALLELHGKDLQHALTQGWINQFQQVEIDKTLSRLCDSMGKCERIKNTIFPATYSLYIHLAVNLFIAMLPFAVIEYFGWVTIPLVIAIGASFILIEKMAVHLQDPFENKPTDTPMTSIARTIERDLRQVLREYHEQSVNEMPKAMHKFYVM